MDFNEFLQGFSLSDSNRFHELMLISQKTWLPVGWAFLPYIAVVQTWKTFSESIQAISMKFYRDVFRVTLNQIPWTHVDRSK